MLTSLVELAKTEKVRQSDVAQLIDSMFRDAGLGAKEVLTYDDFRAMMRDFNGDFLAVGLDLKGAKHNFLDESDNIARLQGGNSNRPLRNSADICTNEFEAGRNNCFNNFSNVPQIQNGLNRCPELRDRVRRRGEELPANTVGAPDHIPRGEPPEHFLPPRLFHHQRVAVLGALHPLRHHV